jgi:hypothetical protein
MTAVKKKSLFGNSSRLFMTTRRDGTSVIFFSFFLLFLSLFFLFVIIQSLNRMATLTMILESLLDQFNAILLL